ncbi:SpvB/TcaC N-terminal domain-containing protein [Chromobacterium sphagni]|uniref:SpvB/TcaC N-terminal domain-containing protein n=1 Tax=Chromobacterium sphagni TaxID=1903179 RepID=UPI0009F2577A|nr:SpvB/TcaC N-terminal domain-containing protein [Chromobacterium sphagni]
MPESFPVAPDASPGEDDGFLVRAPGLDLPKGGGAMRGIGETFATNPVSGTGTLTLPLPISPGRGGVSPQLSLSYDSGGGNGPFGIGWQLSLPMISRRTDKGLPRYLDAEDSDSFLLSGAEDLVPTLPPQGGLDEAIRDGYRIRRYRPRIEGLFSRIERWTRLSDGDVHWRSISRDNVMTWYGIDAHSRIADPADPRRIFSWLICHSVDGKGNAMVYRYAAENADNVDPAQANERNRARGANRYLKSVRYGNRQPLMLDPGAPDFRAARLTLDAFAAADWMFEVLFDYGEERYQEQGQPDGDCHAALQPGADAGRGWPARADPFSVYRAGFEVRSYRLCRRVLMLHHFAEELATPDYLARSADFRYRETPRGSFLIGATQSGFAIRPGGAYLKRSLPELELDYSRSPLDDARQEVLPVRAVDAASLDHLPAGVDPSRYRWVDLDGEGIAGVLTEQGGGWFYKPNLGDGRLGAARLVSPRPSLARLNAGRQQLLDLYRDGNLELVEFDAPQPGFYPRTRAAGWEPYRTFPSLPDLDWRDANLRFIDLTGDGHPDILITRDVALNLWHPSLGPDGFGAELREHPPWDEERGPRVVFADGSQSVFLADMSGDGLTDLVRIRNGEVCYWPNIGYGRFGAKVEMDQAPWFDDSAGFDQRRILLADTEGYGATDILYRGREGVSVYLNQHGNSLSAPRLLTQMPPCDSASSVTVADFLGKGTACLLWSSPLPAHSRRPLWYLDLMDGVKPHLLVSVRNNLGAETRVEYTASTEFYLADQAAGAPWLTRLPFPVQVVSRVETRDLISGNRFVSRYSYHHGYYDGLEREFRGFARVDQCDTEAYAAGGAEGPPANFNPAFLSPPVLIRTWYHTGAQDPGGRVSRQLEREFYREPGLSPAEEAGILLDDTVLPPGLSPQDIREAIRSLKGARLRQEVYAQDGLPESARPYSVAESNFTIVPVQPRGPNRYAVFFTHAREALEFHYERKLFAVRGGETVEPAAAGCAAGVRWLADPRVSHAMTLQVDGYGNIRQSLALAYGRRFRDGSAHLSETDRARQRQLQATLVNADYTHALDEADAYRAPLPASSLSYELIHLAEACAAGPVRPEVAGLLRFDTVRQLLSRPDNGAVELPYEDVFAAGAVLPVLYRRLVNSIRTLYRSNDLSRLLPWRCLESLALPGESYKLAFTAGLLASVYESGGAQRLPDPGQVLAGAGADLGGYVELDGPGRWWMPSGRSFYHPEPAATPARELAEALAHFFLPRRLRNAFGADAFIDYQYDLLPLRTRDALGNAVSVAYDYRVLKPRLMVDPNGNRSFAAFDALGQTVATALRGKEGERLGDTLDGFGARDADPPLARLQAFAATPRAEAVAMLKGATTRFVYDLHRYRRCGEPPFAATLARETHVSDLQPGLALKIQVVFAYSDGFGREIQSKIPAEGGDAPLREPMRLLPDGDAVPAALLLDGEGQPLLGPARVRWVGKGRTVFNNKGKPVKQYQSFFSSTHLFEPERQLRETGFASILLYDPPGRLVATLHPDHSYEKAVFDPWSLQKWDANDTVTRLDPRADPDVGGYFRLLPETDYLPSWYAQRSDGRLGEDERNAARRAAAHADTPELSYMDALGRTVLAIADNGAMGKYPTRTVLDIEGNQRSVRDALGRTVIRYDYDMLGHRIHQASMDAGERWMLHDAGDKPIRAWDSRGHAFRIAYDPLRRPLRHYVSGSGPAADARTLAGEALFEQTEYGEGQPDAAARNLLTRVYRQYDAAGIVTSERYDFKGNVPDTARQLLLDDQALPDWSRGGEVFRSRTVFDAFNRPVQMLAPHGEQAGDVFNVIRPDYNEANLLSRIDTWLSLPTAPAGLLEPQSASERLVAHIEYDAQGQRTRIALGNGAETDYAYDPVTLRLLRLSTSKGGARFQDLAYVYDAVGNITRISDRAQQTLYFDGGAAQPGHDYVYDPIYRLIAADGREFFLANHGPQPSSASDRPRVGQSWPGNPQAVRGWSEEYLYDAVGNILQLLHRHGSLAGSPGEPLWARDYHYAQRSQLEPEKTGNRLSHSRVGQDEERYGYDIHGNAVHLPQLSALEWDFKDQLRRSARQRVADGEDGRQAETTCYVYDAGGDRVRKVTRRQNGSRLSERIYLGGFEIYREYDADGQRILLQRETLHLMAGKQRLALVEAKTLSSRPNPSPARLIRYQFTDHLGSSSLELDDSARIIGYEEYYPYGSTAYQAANRQIRAAAKRYRYTGMERDEESGLNYNRARYYLPWLGRWLSCDPVGLQGGINLYAYAAGNPVAHTDSRGTACDPTVATCMDFEGQEINFTAGNFREVPFALHVDEIDAVRGNLAGGVAGSPSDPANKQMLDRNTNSLSKSNFIMAAPPPNRPSVSIATDPDEAANRFLTGRLSEIDEIKALADDATSNTAPGVRTNAGLRYRMARDPVVRGFVASLGIDPDNLTVQTPSGVAQRPTGSSVNFTPRDADVNPQTGQVVPGPNTAAAMLRRTAAQVAAAEAELEGGSSVAPPLMTPSAPPAGSTLGRLGNAAADTGVRVLPGAGEGVIVTEALGYSALRMGLTRVGAAALSGVEAGAPPALAGAVIGVPAGNAFEGAARDAGLGSTASVGVGTVGAVAYGAMAGAAVVLALATAPVSVPVLAGAAIVGGLSAGFAYLMSHM